MRIVRWALFVLGALFLLYGGVSAQGVNYSGNWALDKAKSDLQGRMNESLRSMTLVIEQSGNDLSAEFQSSFGDRESSDKMVLTIGGEQVSRQGMMGRGTTKSKAQWSTDSKNLIIVSESTFEGPNGTMNMKTTDTYILSADGATLTINRASETPRGARSSTLVFAKK